MLVCGFSDVLELNRYLLLLKWYKENETRSRPPLVLEVQVAGRQKYNPYTVTGSVHSLFDDDDEFYLDKDH
ncbi:hypothetical protein M5689_008226 [Euphorbia peplus]|nr:hypothetical protein M5689_008226 [Euphorbia peplus]